MKTLLKFLMVFALMLVSSVTLLAQEVTGAAVTVNEFTDFFTTFAALVAAIPVVVEFIKKLFKFNESTPKFLVQFVSWVIGILLTMFGWWFKLGFLIDIEWYYALMYGFGASLAANGIADTKIIQWIFTLFIKKK